MLDKAAIFSVQPEDLDYYWPIAVDWIQDALEHTDGETTIDRIRSDIANLQNHLWIIKFEDQYLAAIVTLIRIHYSGMKTGEIIFAGGKDHEKWDHFEALVGQYFKSEGCKYIDIIGRQGWKRLYEKKGYSAKYLVMRREL